MVYSAVESSLPILELRADAITFHDIYPENTSCSLAILHTLSNDIESSVYSGGSQNIENVKIYLASDCDPSPPYAVFGNDL